MRIDRTRFGFIRATGTLMDRALQKVNLILQGMVDAKPYRLDWEHVLSEYDRLGVGDVAEFASSYAFGWHAQNNKLDDDVSKQAMYLEIIEGVVQRRENVK
ncbi:MULTISPECIES: hypothetical protein [Flavobacteriaceae]|uniref:Uncharacterized protein n=1 Tax=Arenibacter algicola TaxID=616991 RepID=A0A221V459_9FLAO|nr:MULTISPECIES: hypothetical protein [Flavobacteriaceae]ASO08397.1 hypothetical protein AREALGSMS7_05025 [Arenibacter algicola]USD26991.1 hypothetical protein MJO53_16870 [Allomuricauda aquimarina]